MMAVLLAVVVLQAVVSRKDTQRSQTTAMIRVLQP